MGFDRLIEKINEKKNPSVVGLDPKLDYVPEYIRSECINKYGCTAKAAAKALLKFNKEIIDAVCGIVPAVKPQSAYYEMYGPAGVKCLYKTIRYAEEKGLFVIADCKRNDIGATMEAYTAAYLGGTDIHGSFSGMFSVDALTVNGYLGTDGIKPAHDACKKYDKGIFVLVKTSNPSSGEFQDRLIDGEPLYLHMGRKCEEWGADSIGKYGYSAVGAVVGATYPEQLSELRKKLPHTFFLVPGYGAQGGGAEGVAKAFDRNGSGAIVNSSRAIMLAYRKGGYDERDFAKAAVDEAVRMRDEITAFIK